MPANTRHILNVIFFVLLLFGAPTLYAEVPNEDSSPEASTALSDKAASANQQLLELITSIEDTQQELSQVKKTLAKTKDELDAKALIEQRDNLSLRYKELLSNFESVAIGGIDLTDFQLVEPQAIQWEQEIKEIFRPLLDEIKRLTERPRSIERLRTERAFLMNRLPIANSALNNIARLKQHTKDPVLLKYLQELEQDWEKRHESIGNHLRLVSFQLEEKLNPTLETQKSFSDHAKAFFSGRGLNIIYAIAAFTIIYSIFKLISKGIIRLIDRKQNQEARIFEKAIQISFRVLAVSLSVFAVIVVFYMQGDWILLGLSLLILIGVAFTLRESLPRYITEAKLLLNLGPVRENERVMYNGIPWRVTSLNFYTTLTNPALAGGIVQLPVHVVLGLQSRRFAKDEPWFPCRPGDYTMLDDGYFGPILMQTPDIVTMRVRGGSTKTYSTIDFLAQNPKNISHGFGLFITFGLDYADQNIITTEIPTTLTNYINEKIKAESYHSYLKELRVEFKEAAESSLNLLILAIFEGKAAENYYGIGRFVQKAAVEACNQYGWSIPFNQVVVHMAENDQ